MRPLTSWPKRLLPYLQRITHHHCKRTFLVFRTARDSSYKRFVRPLLKSAVTDLLRGKAADVTELWYPFMNDILGDFVNEGTKWVRSQREALRPSSEELNAELRNRYSSYFSPSILDAARLCFAEIIPNPTFYATLEERGISIPLDFNQMEGITYDDTILVTEQSSKTEFFVPLVFHELIHVVQYSRLGVDAFMKQYVHGWAGNNFDYYSIPLEKEAYLLQERFSNRETFKVEEEIAN